MKAIQIETLGNPAQVVKAVNVPEASPVNQYDPMMIAGNYGYRPQLPGIMGTEGAGGLNAVVAGVKHLKEGDRTLKPFRILPGP